MITLQQQGAYHILQNCNRLKTQDKRDDEPGGIRQNCRTATAFPFSLQPYVLFAFTRHIAIGGVDNFFRVIRIAKGVVHPKAFIYGRLPCACPSGTNNALQLTEVKKARTFLLIWLKPEYRPIIENDSLRSRLESSQSGG